MNAPKEKTGTNGKKRIAKTVLILGLLGLGLPGCATMLDQKVVAQGGPEPGWVTNPKAPRGEYVFTGEGTYSYYDSLLTFNPAEGEANPSLSMALARACGQALHRANGRLDASGRVPVVRKRTWWKRTQGSFGKQYHAYCELVTK